MSWAALLDLIEAVAGREAAARVESRARTEMGGARITISVKPVLRPQAVEAVAPGRPRQAAEILGVHPTTIYRLLARQRIIR